MAKSKTPESFENAMKQLELIVNQIENDDVGLETALEKYQQGMVLVKFCQDKLVQIEQRIKILDEESNSLKEVDFE